MAITLTAQQLLIQPHTLNNNSQKTTVGVSVGLKNIPADSDTTLTLGYETPPSLPPGTPAWAALHQMLSVVGGNQKTEMRKSSRPALQGCQGTGAGLTTREAKQGGEVHYNIESFQKDVV